MRALLTTLIVLLCLTGFALYFMGGQTVDVDGTTATVQVTCLLENSVATCDPVDARTAGWLDENGYSYHHLFADTTQAATFKNGKRYLTGSHVYQKANS